MPTPDHQPASLPSARVNHAKDTVREFWDSQPCGSSHTTSEEGSKSYFDEVEQARYQLEPFIPQFAEFERWEGKRVLEVGVGLGSDFVRFARAGADLTGVDLTPTAVELVGRRLALEGLDADLHVADAENLPLEDASFDLVYSWGVLHHTPNTELAVSEVRRVTAPGGEARIMLYSRRSWVAMGVWLRYALAHGRPWRSFTSVIAQHMESDGTKAYTKSELERMFLPHFSNVEFAPFLTPYDRRVGGRLAEAIGPRLGWFMGINAKP